MTVVFVFCFFSSPCHRLQRYGTLRVEIEVKKLVDASEEASERAKGPAGTASAADHARQDKKGWG